MKRRFMMWMTIVCILVVGVSVTRMTRDFVVSQGVETAVILNVMDAGNNRKVTTETTAAAAPAERAVVMSDGDAAAREKAKSVNEEMKAETAVEEAAVEPAPAALSGGAEAGSGAIPDVETAAAYEDSVAITEAAEAPAMVSSGSPKAPIDTSNPEAIQETVKSPLDPVIDKNSVSKKEEETLSYDAETFFERFAQTEQNALQLWENVTSDNRTAYLAATEQERVLWDYELNLVYSMIRSRMSEEEAEELKILELEWLKERDLYAEKAAAKSLMKNAQNQNPDYTKALAEKTKERCYWLVSEYEEVLSRDETVQK